jgi:hypothetical protein
VGWPASPPAAFLPSAFRRNDVCLEAILWEVPGIQGKDEIGIALFGAEAEWIVFGVGRNRSSSLCCPIPKESCGKPPSTRCGSRSAHEEGSNAARIIAMPWCFSVAGWTASGDRFGATLAASTMWLLHHITSLCLRHDGSVGLFGLLNEASRQNWRTTLGARRHLGKRGRRKWRTHPGLASAFKSFGSRHRVGGTITQFQGGGQDR